MKLTFRFVAKGVRREFLDHREKLKRVLVDFAHAKKGMCGIDLDSLKRSFPKRGSYSDTLLRAYIRRLLYYRKLLLRNRLFAYESACCGCDVTALPPQNSKVTGSCLISHLHSNRNQAKTSTLRRPIRCMEGSAPVLTFAHINMNIRTLKSKHCTPTRSI